MRQILFSPPRRAEGVRRKVFRAVDDRGRRSLSRRPRGPPRAADAQAAAARRDRGRARNAAVPVGARARLDGVLPPQRQAPVRLLDRADRLGRSRRLHQVDRRAPGALGSPVDRDARRSFPEQESLGHGTNCYRARHRCGCIGRRSVFGRDGSRRRARPSPGRLRSSA